MFLLYLGIWNFINKILRIWSLSILSLLWPQHGDANGRFANHSSVIGLSRGRGGNVLKMAQQQFLLGKEGYIRQIYTPNNTRICILTCSSTHLRKHMHSEAVIPRLTWREGVGSEIRSMAVHSQEGDVHCTVSFYQKMLPFSDTYN